MGKFFSFCIGDTQKKSLIYTHIVPLFLSACVYDTKRFEVAFYLSFVL
jgi:hypothetical protein